jgi:hypothetical protein
MKVINVLPEDDAMSMNVAPIYGGGMKEITLDKKTIEIISKLEQAISENRERINLIFTTVIAQSGHDCKFSLSPDRTKLIEVESNDGKQQTDT